MTVTKYTIAHGGQPLRAAVVADFHDDEPSYLLALLRETAPDVILVVGDVVHDGEHTENAMAFLRGAVCIAPVFCSLGNHEARCGDGIAARLVSTGVSLLDDRYVCFGDFVIGGLSSGFFGHKQGRLKKTPKPNLAWLDGFCAEKGTKLLLSHHPEYYRDYLSHLPVGTVLSGHAHGGQWRAFGRGLFAPGQGMFPRYTSGVYRGKRLWRGPIRAEDGTSTLIVSRGCHSRGRIPRINNEEELIVLEFFKEEQG